MNILFLCTGNSCRSILAEATFNALAPSEHHAISAGSHPKGEVHPRSLALLQREGIPTEGYYSKSWDNLPLTPDVIITVCGDAAGATCPTYLAPAIRAHWGVEDPDAAHGSEQVINAAFEAAYSILRNRIEALLALPVQTLISEPVLFRRELDQMGQIVF